MSDNMQGQAAQDPQDPRPVLWCVGSAFDRRADMLWQNKPCRDVEQVLDAIREALSREATEIKIRDFAFAFPGKAADAAGGEQGFSLHGEKEPNRQPVPEDAPAMRDGLLPCPFCGPGQSQVDVWYDDIAKSPRVGCGHCGVSTGIVPKLAERTEAAARAAWNKRSVGSAPPANPTGSMNTSSSNPLPQDAGRELAAETMRAALLDIRATIAAKHHHTVVDLADIDDRTSRALNWYDANHRPSPNKGEG